MSSLPLAAAFPDLLVHPRAAAVEKETSGIKQALPVVAVTLAVGIGAVLWGYLSNTILAYGDAQSHLAIARRVLDSRTPGVAEFGTVWLPIPHILLMLFVYIDPLWRTGLAGSIIGVGCLVVTTVSLFFSVVLLTGRKSMAWLAVAVLLTNPNFVYVHVTALTEPVLIASMAASTFYLLKWAKDPRWPDLITAGALAACAVGSRYEGWGFAAVCTAMVAWITYFVTTDRFKAEGSALGYVAPPVYAMGMWAFYNWLIFGDPLYFVRSQYSAAAFAEAGASITKGHPVLSFMTYGWDAMDAIGLPVLIAGAIGLLLYAIRTRLRATSLVVYTVVALFAFDVLLLFMGQIIMVTPRSTPAGYYNLRYALLLAPGVALLVAYFGDTLTKIMKPGFVIMLGMVMLGGQAVWYAPNWPHAVTVLEEGVRGLTLNPGKRQVAQYMRENYHGGGILLDETPNDWATLAGIHEKDYIASFNGKLFQDALNHPAESVEWIVIAQNPDPDRVGTVLLPNPLFQRQYKLIETFGDFKVFERQGG